jgi:hypothetical protein
MRMRTLFAPRGAGTMALASHAHGFAGDHMFISALLIDDPNVADEASIPTFSFQPEPYSGEPSPNLYGLAWEYDKRITENFGFALNQGDSWLMQPGTKTANGWRELVVMLKYKPYVSAEHEFVLSVGVQRVITGVRAQGPNGALLGNDPNSSTIPTLYFGKGFGDVPVGWIRPLALTGEPGYQIADKKLKVDPDSFEPVNNGISNGWTRGFAAAVSSDVMKGIVVLTSATGLIGHAALAHAFLADGRVAAVAAVPPGGPGHPGAGPGAARAVAWAADSRVLPDHLRDFSDRFRQPRSFAARLCLRRIAWLASPAWRSSP